ncbi:hypothetical protein AL050_02460 [Pseudomonas syringae pv. daphniphylli]|nr:hypothetical protein AL050_02460 [Pseudomonas syringae pv. daphniphylli]
MTDALDRVARASVPWREKIPHMEWVLLCGMVVDKLMPTRGAFGVHHPKVTVRATERGSHLGWTITGVT